MLIRMLVVVMLMLFICGCRNIRDLNTAEYEAEMERWIAWQDSEERLQAEYGTLLPPPKSNRGG